MFRSTLLALLSAALIVSPASAQTAEEPAPTGPQVHLLSPSAAYNPGSDPTGDSDAPGVSDKPDGVDSLYRLVAWSDETSSQVMAVASFRTGSEEIPIGEMTRSTTTPDTWELLWDVPDEVPAGTATVAVSLSDGDTEIARDEVEVRLSHRPAGGLSVTDAPPDQSVSVTWPTMGGSLGFYRKPGGTWSTVVDGTTSEGTRNVEAFYSKTVPGGAPEFVFCGSLATQTGLEPFGVRIPCVLQGEDTPEQVTAVGLVAEATLDSVGLEGTTQESADVVRTVGRVQSVRGMTVDVSSFGRALAGQCVTFVVSVKDVDGRPVQGANVDVHFNGPEGAGFATGTQNSGSKAPDQGDHEMTPAMNCAGTAGGEQGSHPPEDGAATPTFHRESTDGSGISGPSEIGPGQWRFDLFSPVVGFGNVTAWLDESRSGDGSDDDVIGRREPTSRGRVQWMPATPTLRIDPFDAGADITDGCVPFLARVRSGDVAVPGINVDVEATGPGTAPSFCEPAGSARLTQTEHAPAPGQTDPVRAVESTTDERGNLIFGLTSSAGGKTSINVWIDGESGLDNDVRSSSETTRSTSFWWSAKPGDVRLGFIDPSPYGSGTSGAGSGVQIPETGATSIAVRASVPDLVEQLDLLVSSNGGQNFYQLGTLTRRSDSDVFSYVWTGRLVRGSAILRARVPGTDAKTDLTVQVGPPAQTGETAYRPLQTAVLTSPTLGSRAAFREGATTVAGTASPGAEGVDLFYTRISGGSTPAAADWKFCGFVDLDGTHQATQEFEGSCTLAATDKPWEVSGVAAIAVDCSMTDGCDASQTSAGVTGRGADKDSGDAVRVYGYEAGPAFSFVGPGKVGKTCKLVTVVASDATGEGIPHQSVAVGLEGHGVTFCGASRRYLRRGAGTLTVTTLIDGTTTFGVTSKEGRRSPVGAWFDADGDGAPDPTPEPEPAAPPES